MIIKRSGGNFEPAPAGTWAAVCVDIVDLGMVSGFEGKPQHKIKVVWQIDENRADGKPHQVNKRYTPSLHEKASLRQDLESWRGRAFTEEELDGWEIEQVIGVGCLLCVIQQVKGGNIYANVQSIMRLPKNMPSPAPRDYQRIKDRPVETSNDHNQHVPDYPEAPPEYASGITDDDVPF